MRAFPAVLLLSLVLAPGAAVAEQTVAPAAPAGAGAPAAAALPGTDGTWIENEAQAKASATATQRPILIDFTGSDWCVWCKRLESEVFANEAFTSWAKTHVVLLRCDFPQTKELDAATKQQNDRLADTWHIEGFPTVLLLSPKGEKLASLGYQQGGPQAWLAALAAQQQQAQAPSH